MFAEGLWQEIGAWLTGSRLEKFAIEHRKTVALGQEFEPGELVFIFHVQLQQLGKRSAQRRLALEVSLPAKQWLAQRGFDPVYGARPLRGLIQQVIVDHLTKMLLAGEVHDCDMVPVNVSPDGDSLVLG